MRVTTPQISIVIPIHNEEVVLPALVSGISSRMAEKNETYELILCENGSTDNTYSLAVELTGEHPQIVLLTSPRASYGMAIRDGILRSEGDHIVIFNADLWDMDFLAESTRLLRQFDMVIASKRHPDSHDQRPWNRRFITWGFNTVLRMLFGFKGTDTHGMKAFRRESIAPVIQQCVTDGEIFDTEIILRGERAGLTRVEVPTTVEETRPSRYGLFVRVPRTLRDLRRLYTALHFGRI
jgi:glycosyltransferase involved in cell wall biosynthesis